MHDATPRMEAANPHTPSPTPTPPPTPPPPPAPPRLTDWATDPAPVGLRPKWRHGTPIPAGARLLRFRAPAGAGSREADCDRPSPAIIAELDKTRDRDPRTLEPEFAREIKPANDKLHIRLRCPPGSHFYGTGEVAGPLLRNSRGVTLWNTDSFGYDLGTPSLYQSHPWVLGLRGDGTAFGLLIDTPGRCEITLGDDIAVVIGEERQEGEGLTRRRGGAEGGMKEDGDDAGEGEDQCAPSVYLIEADSPQEVLEALASLIGTMPLPPMWALGFHQCRYSYASEHEVLSIAEEFRARWLPCDTIWMDIDYMDRFRCFTFDPHRFPDPEKMVAQLRAQGFRTAWILDPGIVADAEDPAFASGEARGVFVRTAEGERFEGEVWPGVCSFPDFLNADARRWWGEQTARFVRACGADGVWNDMNEPSVFDGPGRTLPVDCVHEADADLGGPDAHERYHNLYGMQMVRATREGLLRERPEKRPFVLSRSNFLGGHRYACCWTGDSMSTWEHLSWTIPMMLNLGLSGQPFAGCDIGGFAEDADAALFARWMGIGCLLPFARAHSEKNTRRHEPWSFGARCENACRLALERRYRLLPYLYTLFAEAERTGLPPMRPLFFADPSDTGLREAEDSFLLGGDVLVRASVRLDNRCLSPMPEGVWGRFEPTEKTDEHLPRLFLRGGAILPMGPIMQHTGERPLDPLTLVVCLDEAGEAAGELYEDAGEGFGYREGDSLLTRYRARREGEFVRLWIEGVEGERERPMRVAEVVVLLADGGTVRGTGLGGDEIRVLMGEGSG